MKKRLNQKITFLSFMLLFSSMSFSLESNYSHKVDILHWWVSGGEKRALQVIKDDVVRQNVKWSEVAVSDYNSLRESMSKRLSLDIPPLVSHWLGGSDLKLLSQVNYLRDLNDLVDKNAIHSEILSDVVFDKKVMGTAQRRLRRFVLFHGSLLVDCDLDRKSVV